MADGTLKVGQITTSSGSGTITIGQSGETITIPTGATITNSGTANNFGGDNTPAFFAYKTSETGISSGAITKVTFDTELYDTNSNYDNSSNYRFTPTVAGKYTFNIAVRCNGNSGTVRYINVYIRKNGNTGINGFGGFTKENNTDDNINSGGGYATVSYDMNGSSDYVEGYVQCHATNPTITYDNNGYTTYFGGYKLIT